MNFNDGNDFIVDDDDEVEVPVAAPSHSFPNSSAEDSVPRSGADDDDEEDEGEGECVYDNEDEEEDYDEACEEDDEEEEDDVEEEEGEDEGDEEECEEEDEGGYYEADKEGNDAEEEEGAPDDDAIVVAPCSVVASASPIAASNGPLLSAQPAATGLTSSLVAADDRPLHELSTFAAVTTGKALPHSAFQSPQAADASAAVGASPIPAAAAPSAPAPAASPASSSPSPPAGQHVAPRFFDFTQGPSAATSSKQRRPREVEESERQALLARYELVIPTSAYDQSLQSILATQR